MHRVRAISFPNPPLLGERAGRRPASPQRLHIRRHGPRSLRHPAFERVWGESLLAYFARFVDYAVVSWLVLQLWGSPLAIGLLIFFRYSSFLFTGPLVGLVADRFPRVRIMQTAQLGTAATALTVAGLLFSHHVSLPILYGYTFINGLLFLFDVPARRTYMSAVVGQRQLTIALALDILGMNGAWFLGSNLGGFALNTVTPGFIYLALAFVAAVNIHLLRDLPVLFRPKPHAEHESFATSLREGVRFARKRRFILGALLVVGLTNLTGFTFETMASVIARDVFNAGPLLFGLLISAQGLGSFFSAFAITVRGKRVDRPGLVLVAASLAMHALAVAFSFLTFAPLAFFALLTLGILSTSFSVMHNQLFLSTAPKRIRGRMVGLQMLVIGLYPISGILVGALGSALGAELAMRIMAGVGFGLILTSVALFPELRRTRVPEGEPGDEEVEVGVAATPQPVTVQPAYASELGV